MPLTNRSLYVLGKKPGSTSLTLYDRNKNLIAVVDLVVGPDVMGLKKQLHDLMPNERVGARISNDAIVLSGIVSSGTAVDRARQIAETYAPGKVVNMMAVGSSRSEEHTSELQSLMRISYAVFCLKKKTQTNETSHNI